MSSSRTPFKPPDPSLMMKGIPSGVVLNHCQMVWLTLRPLLSSQRRQVASRMLQVRPRLPTILALIARGFMWPMTAVRSTMRSAAPRDLIPTCAPLKKTLLFLRRTQGISLGTTRNSNPSFLTHPMRHSTAYSMISMVLIGYGTTISRIPTCPPHYSMWIPSFSRVGFRTP